MKLRKKKAKRMFINNDRMLITDKKGKPMIIFGKITEETVKPKTVND